MRGSGVVAFWTTNRKLVRWAPVLLVAVAACGGDVPSDRPPLVSVSAVVTYHGQPVEAASVVFVSQDTSHSATGMTDAGGKAVLWTFDQGDGVVPGSYQVMVHKVDATPTAEEDDPDALSGPPTTHLIPERYADPVASGLTATVSQEGEEFRFELTD